MAQDADIKKLVEKWKKPKGIPSEENIETVWKVALAYSPESEKKKKRGNDRYYVKWEQSVELARLRGNPKLDPFETEGSFLLPLKKGKSKTRRVYIKKLLKAIEWKEQYDEIRSRKD